MTEQKCCARIYSSGAFSGHICGKKAKVERDGKNYCGTHDPVRLKQIRAANTEKFNAEYAARSARQREANRLQEEQKRRAECFTDLFDTVQELMRNFPTDSDLIEAGWSAEQIENAMRAHEKVAIAIKKSTA